MKKLFLKILILCVILTGSVFAIETEAQNTLEIKTKEIDTIGTIEITITEPSLRNSLDGFRYIFINIYKKDEQGKYSLLKKEEFSSETIATIKTAKKQTFNLKNGDYRIIATATTKGEKKMIGQTDFSVKNSTIKQNCEVINAKFNPSGTQPAGWFKESQRPKVSVDIETRDCDKHFLVFSLTEDDYFGDDQIDKVEEQKIKVPDTGKISLQFEAGETDCDSEDIPECKYYIEIEMKNANDAVVSDFSSEEQAGGELSYDCDGVCISDWKPLNMPESGEEVTLNADMTANVDTDTTYRPLAFIPGIADGCKNPDGTIIENCIDTAEQGAFAKYFNALITVFIGICAVLAMIMIVIGGMQYMTSELVSGKEEAKKRIWGAVGGLILALASYAILNTINPNLLDIGLGGLTKAQIEFQDETETTSMAVSGGKSGSTEPTKLCPEGFENITTNTNVKMFLCKKISQKVKNMIEKAKQENIVLAGGAYRSPEEQKATRARNCGGTNNIFNKNAKCEPPTAYPGTSRHEQGLAIDFTCDRVLIQTKDNKCFLWLQRNAASYGLKNFDKEPWHWSFDGR
jgi:hypothetical protein